MDHLGLVKVTTWIARQVIGTIAAAANSRFGAGLGDAFSIFDRDILGGFNRSSQHQVNKG